MILNHITNYGQRFLSRAIGVQIKKDGKTFLNLDNYNCFLCGKETTRKAPKFTVQKPLNSFVRTITKTEDNDDVLELQFLFVGDNHDYIWRSMRKLSNDMKECTIRIDTEEYIYDCILTDYSDKFLDWNTAVCTIKFEAQCFSEAEYFDILNGYGLFEIRGAKDTPINYTVKAKSNVSNVHINDIVIKNMNAGDVLTIDGFSCKVEINGENAIDNVEIWEFPMTRGQYEINVDNKNVDVVMNYRARW